MGFRCVRFSRHNTLLVPAFALPPAPAPLPGGPSPLSGTLPYRPRPLAGGADPAASALRLAPLHCRRRTTRPVSCYALFQGWLLLSQPPGCLGRPTAFPTRAQHLGALAGGLGCFPLDDESSHPPSHSRRAAAGIRGLVGVGKRQAPSSIQRPTSGSASAPGLNLNPFRGEPAISGFDWHFTPTHSSSVQFCNIERCAPPVRVTGPSRWPWVAHPVSGLRGATLPPPEGGEGALFGLAFAAGAALRGPYPAAPRNSPAHSSIGTRSAAAAPPRGAGARLSPTVGRRFQGLFHSPRRGAFHLSLAVLVRYRSLGVLSLGPWAARLPAGFLVPRGTHAPAPGRGRGAGYGALTRCGAPFQALRLPRPLLTPRGPGKGLRAGRPTPRPHRLAGH